MKPFVNTTQLEEEIGSTIVQASFEVHKQLGPGLLENIYEICLIYQLRKFGLEVTEQLKVPIIYDGQILSQNHLRLDLIVNNLVIIELKAVEMMHPVFKAQIISYLKLTNKNLGYLINFNVPLIKDGITRIRRN
ncbi:MAG: GxxExxY protein [Bacteroidota bacterium]|nr:GxxExxY protein [Bacteroidota bacterium]